MGKKEMWPWNDEEPFRFFAGLIFALWLMFMIIIICMAAVITFKYAKAENMYDAEVIRVIDGDTFQARVKIWHEQYAWVNVRLRDMDAPEIRGAQCPEEKELGLKAKVRLAEILGKRVILTRVKRDIYARTVAHVIKNNLSVGSMMINDGLAKSSPQGVRQSWCKK
jgi:endonuclease YncB( thermonuclease family)